MIVDKELLDFFTSLPWLWSSNNHCWVPCILMLTAFLSFTVFVFPMIVTKEYKSIMEKSIIVFICHFHFWFPKLDYRFRNCSILRATTINNMCMASCFTACANSRVMVHGLENVLLHVGGRGRHCAALFSAIIATFTAAVGWAVTRPHRSIDLTVWSFQPPCSECIAWSLCEMVTHVQIVITFLPVTWLIMWSHADIVNKWL